MHRFTKCLYPLLFGELHLLLCKVFDSSRSINTPYGANWISLNSFCSPHDCYNSHFILVLFWQTLRKIVTDTLNIASQNNFTTVGLPALGTGVLDIPRDVAAEVMFDVIGEFSKTNLTTVKDVRIVLYHKDQQTIDVSVKTFTSNRSFYTNSVGLNA